MITLKTLEQASAKEVFEQVKMHLLTQNKQSTIGHGLCAYRGNDGLKCAAGCLIGDDEYDETMERKSWSYFASKGRVPEKHVVIITELQEIHDNYPPFVWHDELTKTAIKHGFEQ